MRQRRQRRISHGERLVFLVIDATPRSKSGVANDAPKTGWLSRSTKLFNMAARIAGSEVRGRMKGSVGRSLENLDVLTRVEQARIMVEHLGQLKGAVMKAGQLLSIDASDLLPPEAMDVLSRLQSEAEPVEFDIMARVLDADLGASRDRLDVDPEPAASASIGQVHRGTFEGRDVAVKIQYPGIRESIDSDIGALERVASSFVSVARRQIDLADTFRELRHILHLEADYEREADNLRRYGAAIAHDARFVVPMPHGDVSGPRVLTMDWASGQPLHAWIRSGPRGVEREGFARALLDLYCLEFFEWGFVQTDPNHGNYLITGDGRVVLLDLGAALEYDTEFRARYVELLKVIGTQDDARIIQAGIDFELIDAREGDATKAAFAQLLRSAVEPFLPSRQPFRFRDEDYAQQARVVARAFTTSLRYSPPPRRLLFLHRKLGGLFQLLKRLDVTLDLIPYWERMVGTDVRDAPVTPSVTKQ
jgi:aarF domain-containing kinase